MSNAARQRVDLLIGRLFGLVRQHIPFFLFFQKRPFAILLFFFRAISFCTVREKT